MQYLGNLEVRGRVTARARVSDVVITELRYEGRWGHTVSGNEESEASNRLQHVYMPLLIRSPFVVEEVAHEARQYKDQQWYQPLMTLKVCP